MKLAAPQVIVHILHHGLALCGQPGLPCSWPKGHAWTRLDEAHAATCSGCKAAYEKRCETAEHRDEARKR